MAESQFFFFLSSNENNFEITISCLLFAKFCVWNSTLTFIVVLCRPALRYTQASVRNMQHFILGYVPISTIRKFNYLYICGLVSSNQFHVFPCTASQKHKLQT